MTPRERLSEIKRLINSGWSKGAFARDAGGQEVHPVDKTAQSWCVVGAMHKVSPYSTDKGVVEALKRALERKQGKECDHPELDLERFNDEDDMTKQDIIALIEQAVYECVI